MTSSEDLKQRLRDAYGSVRERLATRIVGMEEVIDLLVCGIFSEGHCLLVGVPGLAKTLLVSSLADLLDLKFSRIQFTPDLMPSDIVGTEVIAEDEATGERHFRFMRGPVFSQILLADEINRTPPKTQAALMEAMEEHQVTTGGKRHALDRPFFVLATQNPIEQEGTYPLPAAQLDRFTFMIEVDYPSHDEEYRIVRMTTAPHEASTGALLTQDDILELSELIKTEAAPDEVVAYATKLARNTRPDVDDAPQSVRDYLAWGVGPRGAQGLVLAAKVRAIIKGRARPDLSDVRALAPHVFRHRMILNFQAEAEGIDRDRILAEVIDAADGRPTTGSQRAVTSGASR